MEIINLFNEKFGAMNIVVEDGKKWVCVAQIAEANHCRISNISEWVRIVPTSDINCFRCASNLRRYVHVSADAYFMCLSRKLRNRTPGFDEWLREELDKIDTKAPNDLRDENEKLYAEIERLNAELKAARESAQTSVQPEQNASVPVVSQIGNGTQDAGNECMKQILVVCALAAQYISQHM